MPITLKNDFTPEELANQIARNLRIYRDGDLSKNVLADIENTEQLVRWLIWHLQQLRDTAEQNQSFTRGREIYARSDEALENIRTVLGDKEG